MLSSTRLQYIRVAGRAMSPIDTANFHNEIICIGSSSGPNPKLRRQNMNAILSHIQNRSVNSPLTQDECLQLWRGFHVALYMHDSKSAISVQNLIATLADTIGTFARKDAERAKSLKDKASKKAQKRKAADGDQDPAHGWLINYTLAFWETIAREWSSIDKHRMNKYLLLVRFAIREIFKICLAPLYASEEVSKVKEVANELVTQQMGIFKRWPLNGKERKVSDGLRLHVMDVWNDEVQNAVEAVRSEYREEAPGERDEEKSLEDDGLRDEELRAMLARFKEPLEKISQGDSGAQRHIRQRAKDTLGELQEKIEAIVQGNTDEEE